MRCRSKPWSTWLAALRLVAPPANAGDPGAREHPAVTVVRELTRSIDHFDLDGFVASFHDDVTMFYPIDSIVSYHASNAPVE